MFDIRYVLQVREVKRNPGLKYRASGIPCKSYWDQKLVYWLIMNVIEKKRMWWEFVITVKFLPLELTLSLSRQNVTDKPKEYTSYEYAEIPTWALVYESYHFHNAKFDKNSTYLMQKADNIVYTNIRECHLPIYMYLNYYP